MSDDDWDVDDDWEPPAVAVTGSKKFDDEEEEVEEVDENSKYHGKTLVELVAELEKRDKEQNDENLKKHKAKRNAIKEKEEAERIAREKAAEEAAKELTPEEMWAKKMEEQRQIEEADMALAAEFIGDDGADQKKDDKVVEVTLIEAMDPKTDDDFVRMAQAIAKKACKYEVAPQYLTIFLKELVTQITDNMSPEDTKKWASYINVVTNEKNKAIKGKQKPKSKKASLGGAGKGGGRGMDLYENEYDDFM